MGNNNSKIAIIGLVSTLLLVGWGCSKPSGTPEETATTTPSAVAEATSTPEEAATSTPEKTTSPGSDTATKPKAAPASTVRSSFYVEFDDNGFYPSSGTARKGATVTVTFKARSSNVIYNGLTVRANKYDLGSIKGGTSKSISFPAENNITFSSFWPTGAYRGAWTLYVK